MHDSAGGHLADVDRHHTDRAGVACRAALLEGPVCGLVIQCDLGLAGGRLSRCAGRPWHRGVDLGAAARSWLHPPHTRDNPGFGDRSFYALVVDRAGPFGDLRGPGTRASDGSDHLLEFRIEADEGRAALAAFPIDAGFLS